MKCTATAKSTGEQCGRHALAGARVCKVHGGGAPQVRDAAARAVLEQEARQVWAATTHAPVNDPLTELAALAGEVREWKELLKGMVGDLTSLGYRGMTEQIRHQVALYSDAVKQLTVVLTAIAKLNIDSRLVAIGEQQTALVLAALEAGLDAAEVTDIARHRARSATARHLELVMGGQPA
ncbi:hypothetical protein [Amycolatopsis sp. GM8]|uniref:hypothetical protein n=1 Tax=Amycolatopsis sp. GM8 TaxID=2896530 RepID=UPI001F19A604|nr:hypothetical protein [Amycolatopsis sp. GM8]